MWKVKINNKVPFLVFCFLLFLVFINRFITLKTFGFQYTGSDDVTFWQMSLDYSKGIFHEPFFYGQNYNYGLEALFAAPFLWFGTPVYIVLPIVSTTIGVFPFLLFALVLFRKGYFINSYVFLLVPLAMPIEYDIITSITRGFTSGLFFSGFLIFPLLNPTSRKSFFILGFAVVAGYLFNANSLIIAFPVCLYLFFQNAKNPAFYFIPIAIAIPLLWLNKLAENFYINNLDYIVHSMWKLDFSFDAFLHAFKRLDEYFRYLTPIFWGGNWVIVVLIFVLGAFLLKADWKKGLSLILATTFVLVILGVNKISDGVGVIFYSPMRMFLALPILLGLAFFWTKNSFQKEKLWSGTIVILSIFFVSFKTLKYPSTIEKHTSVTNYGPVAIKKIDDLKNECADISEMSERYNADLVVFIPNWERNVPSMEFYNYGCASFQKNLSRTVMNIYERRTWMYQKEKSGKRKNVLLFNLELTNFTEIKNQLDCQIVHEKPTVVLIKNNNKNLEELSVLFDFQLKRNAY